MKTQLILFSVILLFMVSCVTQFVHIEKKFKEDQVVINIDATKSSKMNPWTVIIKVKAYTLHEGSLTFEHQTAHLKSEDITFNWISETTCIIGFPYEDGVVRKFQLMVSPESYQLLEVSE